MSEHHGLRPLRRKEGAKIIDLHPPSAEQRADIAARGAEMERRVTDRGFAFGERRAAAAQAAATPAPAPWAPTSTPGHPATTLALGKYRLDALTAGAPPPQQFTLAPLFPLGTVAVLFGPGGIGKSMLALDLCMSVARRAIMPPGGNLDFNMAGPLGCTIPREAGGAVVFVTMEDATAEVHRRRYSLDPDMTCANAPVFVIPALDIPHFTTALICPAETGRGVTYGLFVKALETLLDDVKANSGMPVRLLMLDPAGDFMDGDENDAQFIKPLMALLREMAARHGCTIILVGHTSKERVDDDTGPTMRGSGAWIANSRAAYGIWKPARSKAEETAKKLGCHVRDLAYGMLVKGNHQGAPTDERRTFRRDAAGRLVNVTAISGAPMDETALLTALVDSCREAAEAGLPFQHTGAGGLYEDHADLPPCLAEIGRDKLRALGTKALDAGRLVKAKNTTKGAPRWLDDPSGPFAQGRAVLASAGSRREAIARLTGAQARGDS